MHTATPTRPRVSAVAYLPARPPLIPAGLSRIRFHEMEIRSDQRRWEAKKKIAKEGRKNLENEGQWRRDGRSLDGRKGFA